MRFYWWDSHNGIGGLIGRGRETILFSLSQVRRQKAVVYKPGRELSPEFYHTGILISISFQNYEKISV